MNNGSGSRRWATKLTRKLWPATSSSRWGASRPSSQSTTWKAPSGIMTPSARKNGPSQRALSTACANASPLPRWALSCYWRKDGVPLWQDRALLAKPDEENSFGPTEAQRFAETLARRLGLDPEYVKPAFEDPVHYLERERNLPINVDVADNRLENPGERERVRRVFDRGLKTPVGYVLPIQRGDDARNPE